jgi:hypothetical protein
MFEIIICGKKETFLKKKRKVIFEIFHFEKNVLNKKTFKKKTFFGEKTFKKHNWC